MKLGGRYIKDIVYGANDGIITTFAVVAGVTGASLDSVIIILLGVANLIADGFSMAASSYLGSKSEEDAINEEYTNERLEIETSPDSERNEMVALLEEQGYGHDDAQSLTGLMFKNKTFFTDLMVHEGRGVSSHGRQSARSGAIATFCAFVIAGLIPIMPFLFFSTQKNLFLVSAVSTGVALFVVGSLRAFFTGRSWLFSGFQMLGVGGCAAVIAYSIGAWLKALIG